MLRLATCLILTLLLSVAPLMVQAASMTTSGSFGTFSHGNIYTASDTGASVFLEDTPVSGLSKFDPALGTLDAVLFTLHTSADYSYALSTDGPIDPAFNISADVFGLSSHEYTAVTWVPGVSGTTVFSSPVFDGIFPSCTGLGACSDGMGPVTAAVDAVGADITTVVSMPDIVGTGSIDPAVFTVGVAFPEALSFDLVNTAGATLDIMVDYPSGGVVKLEYLFTPVPLPAAVWLLLSALLLLFGVRTRHQRMRY